MYHRDGRARLRTDVSILCLFLAGVKTSVPRGNWFTVCVPSSWNCDRDLHNLSNKHIWWHWMFEFENDSEPDSSIRNVFLKLKQLQYEFPKASFSHTVSFMFNARGPTARRLSYAFRKRKCVWLSDMPHVHHSLRYNGHCIPLCPSLGRVPKWATPKL
jgi:hypothetical protein